MITTKAIYKDYPLDFSILSDFNEEDLVGMMDIGEKYSHMGSYYMPGEITESTWKGDYVASDLCPGFESYSTSSPRSTSWASAIVHAAEYALTKAGYEERLSLRYVLKCLPEFSEAQPNEIRTSDIISFIAENGLMTYSDAFF